MLLSETKSIANRFPTNAVTAFVALALMSGAVAAEPGEFVDGVLQPLADGFPERAITIVVVDEPGSRDGVYARSLQESLRDISPVDILVSDEPSSAFGNFPAYHDIQENREGGTEGYYPVVSTTVGVTLGLLIDPIEEELGMGLDDLNIILVTETIPYTMIQRKDAPWGNGFEEWVEYAKANPEKLTYVSNQVGTGTDVFMEWIMDQSGITGVQKIPATNQQAAATAVAAGEGDFSMLVGDVALTHWEAERVDVLLVSGGKVPPPWNEHPEIVSAEAYGFPVAPWGVPLGLATGKEVPPSHVEWLGKLFKAAAETEHHRRRQETFRIMTMETVDGKTANELKERVYEYADPLLRKLGMHKDSK